MKQFEDEVRDRLFVSLGEKIPDQWYEPEELETTFQLIHNNLVDSMSVSVEQAAAMMDCTPEDVEDSLENAAKNYAKMALFDEKFPELVAQFPVNSEGGVIYPSNILSRIYGVTEEEAIKIFEEIRR